MNKGMQNMVRSLGRGPAALLIVNDGTERQALEEEAFQRAVSGRVVFAGGLTCCQIAPYDNAARGFWLVSTYACMGGRWRPWRNSYAFTLSH
jgi:hypothetical protein